MVAKATAELGPSTSSSTTPASSTPPGREFPAERWDAVIAINLSADFHAIRAAMPQMKARNWGRIINIASAHGLVASPKKVGLRRRQARRHRPDQGRRARDRATGVTCNAICPGWVLTPLVQKQIDDPRGARRHPRERGEARAARREKQPSLAFVDAGTDRRARGVPLLRPPRRSAARRSRSTAAGPRSNARDAPPYNPLLVRPAPRGPTRRNAHEPHVSGRSETRLPPPRPSRRRSPTPTTGSSRRKSSRCTSTRPRAARRSGSPRRLRDLRDAERRARITPSSSRISSPAPRTPPAATSPRTRPPDTGTRSSARAGRSTPTFYVISADTLVNLNTKDQKHDHRAGDRRSRYRQALWNCVPGREPRAISSGCKRRSSIRSASRKLTPWPAPPAAHPVDRVGRAYPEMVER